MDEAHPFSAPMVVQSLDVEKNSFHPKKDGKAILGLEVPYLSAIYRWLYKR